MRWSKVWTVARIDLHRLFISKDYWIPMVILGGIFFVFIPWVLLGVVTRPQSIDIVQQRSDLLPPGPGVKHRLRCVTPDDWYLILMDHLHV